MKLLTITLMSLLSTFVYAAGGEGAVGSPENIVSVKPLDDQTSVVCYQEKNSNALECIVINH